MFNVYKMKKIIVALIITVVLIAISVVDLGPIYFLVVTSLKTKAEYLHNIFGLPKDVTFENFKKVIFVYDFPRMFINSIILTFFSIAAGIYISAFASYAFGKMNFRGKNTLLNMIIPLMSIPAIVMFIPLFIIMTKLDLVNRYPAPIIIYTGLIIPFTIYLLTSFMNSVPDELLEAARIDGCSNISIFHRIVLPLMAPAITTSIIINGMWIWNELLIAFIFLQSESKRTLIVGLTSLQGLYNRDIPLMMAGATVVSIPMIIAYIVSQRWFIKGLVQGSIK